MTNKTPTSQPPVRANRIERILAIAVVVLVVAAFACFIAVIAATALGGDSGDWSSRGVWPIIFVIQYYGLPIAFVLIIALLVSNGVRRSRAAKSGER